MFKTSYIAASELFGCSKNVPLAMESSCPLNVIRGAESWIYTSESGGITTFSSSSSSPEDLLFSARPRIILMMSS